MSVRQLLAGAAVVVMALGACRGERRADVTGSYGSAVLAGRVVLDGIDGTPEGVEVSVRDTGMSTILGADGRFAFAGVPENAILDFRRADGIDASLAINGSHGSISVELGKRGASKEKGRGNNTRDKKEFEGVIKAAGAEEITLLTSHNEEILIGLTTETVIRKGNELLTPADLKEDMRVHVRARKGLDDKLTAQLILVQNEGDDGEDDRPAVRQFEGTVVSASDSELVVFTSHRVEMTFTLDDDTVIRKGNTPVAPADLLPGQRVHVKATVAADGAATAVLVIVQNTHSTVSVGGTVVSVSGSDILVQTESGDVTVQTNDATRIRKKGKTIGVGDIVAGDVISARGTRVSESVILATEVEVRGKRGHP